MYSIGQTYQLKPGFYNQYKKAHDELWPELAEAMTVQEVNMVIFRYGDRLFLYATAPSKEQFEQAEFANPRAQEWQEFMATMMITDESGKTIVEEMDIAFSFGAFKVNP